MGIQLHPNKMLMQLNVDLQLHGQNDNLNTRGLKLIHSFTQNLHKIHN